MSVFTNPASGSVEHARAYIEAVLGLVEGSDPREILGRTTAALERTVDAMSDDELARPEGPGKWSVGAVIRHLADSEIVWGWRLRMALAHDGPEITGYDQDAWADRLGYGEAPTQQSLEEFSALRRGHLWLFDRASAEDLERYGVHVERGKETVAHQIRLYAGHDLLHLRQIERVRSAVA